MSENSNVVQLNGNEEQQNIPRKKSGQFLREVMVELKKTTWLTKNELIKSTMTVLLTIIVVSIILFCYDWIAAMIMSKLGIAAALNK